MPPLAWALLAVPTATVVAAYGELSPQAFAAVLLAGAVVVATGLVRRAGSGAAPAGPAALPWLGWLVLAAGWELVAFAEPAGRLPTLSDLADPFLGLPPARAAATLVWLGAGWWLLARPVASRADRDTAG
jgi:hypothetical protein